MQLYKLTDEIALITDTIIDAEGEISPELERRLDATKIEFKEKSTAIAKWTFDIAGTEAALDEEIKRLQHKKKVAANLQERLKAYVKSCMERSGIFKIESPTVTLAIQRNPPSIEIVDEEMIPVSFKNEKIIISIDKAGIKSAIEKGETVPGAKMITDKTHLRIR